MRHDDREPLVRRLHNTTGMNVVARNWWALLVRGIVGIGVGIFAMLLPEVFFTVLVLCFGAWALVDGVMNIATAVRDARGERGWWMLLLSGVAGVLAGIAAFVAPAATALILLYVMAGWAVVTGVLAITAAVRLRREVTGEWLLALSGALSIAFGVLVMLEPVAGALAVVLVIGAYAFVSGLVLFALGIRLRGEARRRPPERVMRRAA